MEIATADTITPATATGMIRPHKGILSNDRVYVDDPDAKKFYELRQDAMCLDVADLIPNRGELWIVRTITRKQERKGLFWQVHIESPRSTSYSFDPRWDRLGKDEGDPDLRNLRFYRARKGF